ncbi:MAG TPA: T9SS type A sorting domain-containing protein [Candidatus Kapabacteria bacterium]|nr:T9SS type A sorting domain-containing protein [Candidatus Kapabacteria bacterium]HPO63149.1 T9SS type A sorting domain-containing protein [Candidatus Kapabacteria bacterium]
MKTKILLLIAAAMLFAMPLLATTTESDTLWTINIGSSAERFDFVQNDEYIVIGGPYGIYKVRTSNGKVEKIFDLATNLYGFNNEKTNLLYSDDFSIFTMDLESGNIIDSIIIEKIDKYKYIDGDTTNPWDESYLLAPLTSPDGKYILCSWFRSGYRFNSYEPEFIETRTIIIINKETKKIEKEIEIVPNAKCFSPDGNYIAIGTDNNNSEIELYNAKTFEFIKKIAILGGNINGLNFSFDSKYLCCTYDPEKCNIFDIENSEIVFPDSNTKDEMIIQTEFYNNNNYFIYKELRWIENKRVLFFNEYDIEKKLKSSKFENLNIEWIFPGLFSISKNDNYLSVLAYSENKDILLVLIKNNTTKVEEKTEIKKNSISIKPNPSENILCINYNFVNIKQLEIVDINGNSIFKEEITTEENSKIINTSTFLSGTYFLRITTKHGTETYKFVKE